jgi:hypothetical protein
MSVVVGAEGTSWTASRSSTAATISWCGTHREDDGADGATRRVLDAGP